MKRAVASGALWTASAAAAVGLGFLAVSLVGADASPVAQPAATEPVTAAPSASSPSGSGSDDVAAPTPTSPPSVTVSASASVEYATVGGTVSASCDGGLLQVGTAPAAGWWLDDQDQHGEVQFESPTREVEVHVACGDGVPAFRDEGVRAGGDEPEDDGGGRGRGGDDAGSDD